MEIDFPLPLTLKTDNQPGFKTLHCEQHVWKIKDLTENAIMRPRNDRMVTELLVALSE